MATQGQTTKKTTVRQANHIEIGDEYLKQHRKDTMYSRGQWHRYDNGVWSPLEEFYIDKEIWAVIKDFERVRRCNNPTDSAKKSIASYVRVHVSVPEKEIDAWPTLINLQNGIYNLAQDKLLPHAPQWYLTTQLPFEYDPTTPPPPCPLWDQYLNTTFVYKKTTTVDPQTVAFAQEAIGYSLTTDTKYQVGFWCQGEGENGKGVLWHVLFALSGQAATTFNLDLLKRDPYQTARLAGKRVVLCSEVNVRSNSSAFSENGILKALIAGDVMYARQIRERGFDLIPVAKLWLSMNRQPDISDTSHGFWRRVKSILFNHIFTAKEVIPDLKEKLTTPDALSHIFHWSLIGLQRLERNRQFTWVKQSEEATAEYKKESNPVALWIEDECTTFKEAVANKQPLGKPADWEYTSGGAYADFKLWLLNNGGQAYRKLSDRQFKKEMDALGFSYGRNSQGRYYQGLKRVV